jgi:hypothetical protein
MCCVESMFLRNLKRTFEGRLQTQTGISHFRNNSELCCTKLWDRTLWDHLHFTWVPFEYTTNFAAVPNKLIKQLPKVLC